MKVFVTTYFS